MNIHYSVILAFMGQMQDRFATYQEPRELTEKLRLTAEIEGVRGIEAVYPPDFQGLNPEAFRQLLDENGLAVSSVNVNVKSEQKFHLGALTSRDPGIRAEAVQYL